MAGGHTTRPQADATIARIGVVIAAYNEMAGLQNVLPQLPSELDGRPVAVIVASDGSSDGTPALAEQLGATVLHTFENRGKTAAMCDGIRAALTMGCNAVVFLDGDGQHDPRELGAIVAPILDGEADVVLGSRYHVDGSRGATPLNRYVVRTVTCRILNRLLGADVTDPYCGYRALNSKALDSLAFTGSRYQCELEMLFGARRAGLRMVEVPVARIYGSGMSKMGARHGKLLGRLGVLAQYSAALLRGARQLRRLA